MITHEFSIRACMHSHQTSSQSAGMCNQRVFAPADVDVSTTLKVIVVNSTSKAFIWIVACCLACRLNTSMQRKWT